MSSAARPTRGRSGDPEALLADSRSQVVAVEIFGQRYPIRSTLDPAYVAELATYVDEKMQSAADETPTGDTTKLAVLAALNIADELFRSRQLETNDSGRLLERAREIERLLDRALALTDGS
jgi:cell division protein ZapA